MRGYCIFSIVYAALFWCLPLMLHIASVWLCCTTCEAEKRSKTSEACYWNANQNRKKCLALRSLKCSKYSYGRSWKLLFSKTAYSSPSGKWEIGKPQSFSSIAKLIDGLEHHSPQHRTISFAVSLQNSPQTTKSPGNTLTISLPFFFLSSFKCSIILFQESLSLLRVFCDQKSQLRWGFLTCPFFPDLSAGSV